MPKRKRDEGIIQPLFQRKRTRNEFDQRHKIRCGVYHIPDNPGWYIEIKKVFSTTNPMLKEAVKLLSENLNKGYVKARWGRTEHVAGMYCPLNRMRAAIILVLDDEHVEIHTAATSRYYMRQHLGSILVSLVIEWTRVALVTRASDQPEVIGFWRSMGFEISKDSHHSTAPPRANEKTVFMRYIGEKTGVLERKLPKFQPKKMKRITIKHTGSGRSNVDLYIRHGEVVGSDMKSFPQRSPEFIDAVVRLACTRTKKQMRQFPELVRKLRPVTFKFDSKSLTLYRLPRAKPKPKKVLKPKKAKVKKFVTRKYLITFLGPGFEETQYLANKRVAEDTLFKDNRYMKEWAKVPVKVLSDRHEHIDVGHIFRRVPSKIQLKRNGRRLPKNTRRGRKKKTVAARNYCLHLTREELIARIRALDPSFKYDEGYWCRYCGARASSGWGRSPWGSKKLCNSHTQKWRSHKLLLPEMEPIQAINPEASTELGYLRFKLKKMSAMK